MPRPELDGRRGRPGCFSCAAFLVTHEARWPYACQVFAMKTRRLPSAEVREASGEGCQAFRPRRSGDAS